MADLPARIPSKSVENRQHFWQRAIRRLSRQINLGWWLASWLPMAAAIGLVGMVAMLYARWRAADSAAWVAGGTTGAFAVAAVTAWWRSRPRFESPAASRVRLEDALGLNAQLTAAAAGIGAWPERPSPVDTRWPVVWQWQRPAAAVACIAAMLGLAAWVPITAALPPRPHTIEKPTDARLVEQWIEELETAELIDRPSAEKVSQQIQKLTERPADEWYEHASLEAAGTLKEQTAAAMQQLAKNVAAAEQAAAMLQALETRLPEPLRESLTNDLAAAIKGLERSDLQPAGDLATLLSELKAADLGQLTTEQLAALAERLAANRAALHDALGNCTGFTLADIEGWCEACSGCEPCGECEGCSDGRAGQKPCSACGRTGGMPGRGGLARGRADADLTFGAETDLGTTTVEQLNQTIATERTVPDAVLGVVDGEHDVDETAYSGPRAGGGIASEGDGGSAVQIDALLPAEQAAVTRFFEKR